MKFKYLKSFAGISAGTEVEMTAEDAKTLGAVVEEVKVSAEDITAKAADELIATVEARIEQLSTEKAEAAVAKAFKSVKIKPRIEVGPTLTGSENSTFGFKNFGQMAKAVKLRDTANIQDPRLDAVLKFGMNEGDGTATDGNYVIPVDYSKAIFAILMSEQSLLPKTTNFPTQTAYGRLPIDNLVTIGNNPIGATWISPDNTQMSPTGTGFVNQLSFTLSKVGTLIAASDELLDDNNVLLEQFLTRKAAYAINYAIDQSIMQGTGTNQPTGIIGNAATATVAVQTESSVVGSDEYVSGHAFGYRDICAMYARFLTTESPRPVWIINRAMMSSVYEMEDDSGRNLWVAPGNVAQTPQGSIFGIPIMPSFHCATPGSVGDIVLADMGAYITFSKNVGIQAATSLSFYFDRDAQAFRFTLRIDGKPGLLQALKDPNYASNGITYSPFVTLAARS